MLPKKKKRPIKSPRQAVLAALKKTANVVTGKAHFNNDFQARAALTLVRLGKDFFDPKNEEPDFRQTNPEWFTPKAKLQFARLAHLGDMTPEQHAEWDRRREEAYAFLDRVRVGRKPLESAAEMDEYFRTHRILHDDEIEESLWPPHLRFDTIGLGLEGEEPEGEDHE